MVPGCLGWFWWCFSFFAFQISLTHRTGWFLLCNAWLCCSTCFVKPPVSFECSCSMFYAVLITIYTIYSYLLNYLENCVEHAQKHRHHIKHWIFYHPKKDWGRQLVVMGRYDVHILNWGDRLVLFQHGPGENGAEEMEFASTGCRISSINNWVFPKIGIPQNGWWISWKTLF